MKVKQYRKILIVVLMICAAIFFGCVERLLSSQLSTQQVAKEWSEDKNYAQISCFFTEETAITRDQIVMYEQKLKTALQEAAEDTNDANGRNLIDCYSREGELTIYSDRASVTARAFGVGGDFFTFHPLKLLSGNYFSEEEDVNGDGVIIDENVAWQLFGSDNVAGMMVEIDGVQYPIRGVVKSDKGHFSTAAKEEDPTVYVAFGILEGEKEGLDGPQDLMFSCYEVLIKNPVKGFGLTAVKTALGFDEADYEIIENSARYHLLNRFQVLRNFGIRSMNTKNIAFPYWENRARGYEDISALLLVLELLCLIYPLIFAGGILHWLWRHKGEIKKKAFEKIMIQIAKRNKFK